MSPTLFNLVLERIIRTAKNKKNRITDQIQTTGYADDLPIVAKTKEGLTDTIHKLSKEATKFGLQISEKKQYTYTNYGRKNTNDRPLKTYNYTLENVTSFNCLGKGKDRMIEK